MCSAGGSAALPASGFPHSGIHGSKAVQRLTVAYRSRPRPSSTLGAKASTMCPYYLDGDQGRIANDPAGDTRATRRLIEKRVAVAAVQLSRAGREGDARARTGTRAGERATHARFAGGHGPRSLKTQQHARARARRYASLARPGSVDVLGRTVGNSPR